jgi:hypothetical protein
MRHFVMAFAEVEGVAVHFTTPLVALEPLPVLGRPGSVGEVKDVQLRFLTHGVESGMQSCVVSREFREDRSSQRDIGYDIVISHATSLFGQD